MSSKGVVFIWSTQKRLRSRDDWGFTQTTTASSSRVLNSMQDAILSKFTYMDNLILKQYFEANSMINFKEEIEALRDVVKNAGVLVTGIQIMSLFFFLSLKIGV